MLHARIFLMIGRLLFAGVLSFLALALWASTAAQRGTAPKNFTPAQVAADTQMVTRVLDGDTIVLAGGKKVRYIGIDTPELYGGRNAECFAQEAQKKNQELVLGKRVRLESDVSESDKYGRLLRYVYVGDVLVNETLVREGYAHARSYPPDTTRQETLRAAEVLARTENIGLWAEGVCK